MRKIQFITNRQHEIDDSQIEITTSTENLINFLDNNKLVGYDKETSALNPFNAIELLDAIGNEENVFVVDKTSIDTSFLSNYQDDHTYLGHNIKYDFTISDLNGFTFRNVYDTMITERVLGRGSGRSNTLEETYKRRCKKQYPISKDTRNDFPGATKSFVFNNQHVLYAAADIYTLFEIKAIQEPLIEEYGLRFYLETISFPLQAIIGKCENQGIRLNHHEWGKILSENKARRNQLEMLMDEEIYNLTRGNIKALGGKFNLRRNRNEFVALDLFGEHTTITNECKNNINYKSPKQVLELFKLIDNKVPKGTDLKTYEVKPSVGDQALEQYKIENGKSPMVNFINLYLEYVELSKAITSFGDKFMLAKVTKKGSKSKALGYHNPVTGNVHTVYKQETTDNGRFASGSKDIGYFNSQQIPKQPKYRVCFGLTPEEEQKGYFITTADLSAAELVILGALSKDLKLVELVKRGDVHSYLATAAYTDVIRYIVNSMPEERAIKELSELLRVNRIYKVLTGDDNKPILGEDAKLLTQQRVIDAFTDKSIVVNKKEFKDIRDPFKNVVYGTLYGSGEKKVAETLNISVDYAKIILQGMKRALPQAFNFLDNASRFGVKNGYIKFNNRTNNRHWFKKILSAWENNYEPDYRVIGEVSRACKNYPISGTQADMIKESIVEIDKYTRENNIHCELRLQVHDELVYVHEDESFGHTIKRIMVETCNKYLNGVEMDVDFDTLKTWTK